MITYLLQASACLIAFYAIYFLLLRRNKFFNLQRVYLVMALVVSFIIPFITFGNYQPTAIKQLPAVPGALAFEDLALATATEQDSLSFSDYLAIGYAIITAFLLMRLLMILIRLVRTIRSGEKRPLGRYTLLYTDQPIFIASFFRYIFVQRQLEVEEESLQYMLIHEEKHLKELHFFDLVLLEITKLVCWFNPITYFYAKSIKTVHEYICDDEVIKHTTPENYEKLLIKTWLQRAGLPLVSQFHEISIKNRINMIKKQNNKWYSKLRFLATIPVALLLIVACNQENLPTISQARTIVGKVINSKGEAFPGATVVVEGSNVTTITDMTGKYEITIEDGDAENLIYSFNGLSPVSVPIGQRSVIDVALTNKGGNSGDSYTELPAFDAASFTYNDQKMLTGKITTSEGNPMPGVNVIIEGTKKGSITDIDGEYQLMVPDEGGVISYSFIGFNTERVVIEGRSVIDVAMDASGRLGSGELFLPGGKKEPIKVVSSEIDRNGKRFLTGRVTTENDEALSNTAIFVLRENKVVSLGETSSNGSFEIELQISDSKVFFKHKAYLIGIRSIGQ